MKKLVLAALAATVLAGSASAGELIFRNYGWFDTWNVYEAFDGTLEHGYLLSPENGGNQLRGGSKELNVPDGHNISSLKEYKKYTSDKDFYVRFGPNLAGYGATEIHVKPTDSVIVEYYGTFFKIWRSIKVNGVEW